jgi:hypothetical protein
LGLPFEEEIVTEWMEFDPKNDPRIKEVDQSKEDRMDQEKRMQEVKSGCFASFMLGIVALCLAIVVFIASRI